MRNGTSKCATKCPAKIASSTGNHWASPDRSRCNLRGSYRIHVYTNFGNCCKSVALKKTTWKNHILNLIASCLGASQVQIARQRVHLNSLLPSLWLCHCPRQQQPLHWLLRGSFLWELLTAVCSQKCPFHLPRWPPHSTSGLPAALACDMEWPQLELQSPVWDNTVIYAAMKNKFYVTWHKDILMTKLSRTRLLLIPNLNCSSQTSAVLLAAWCTLSATIHPAGVYNKSPGPIVAK